MRIGAVFFLTCALCYKMVHRHTVATNLDRTWLSSIIRGDRVFSLVLHPFLLVLLRSWHPWALICIDHHVSTGMCRVLTQHDFLFLPLMHSCIRANISPIPSRHGFDSMIFQTSQLGYSMWFRPRRVFCSLHVRGWVFRIFFGVFFFSSVLTHRPFSTLL